MSVGEELEREIASWEAACLIGVIRPRDPAESDLPWWITGKVLSGDRGLPAEGGLGDGVVLPLTPLVGNEGTAGEPGLCLASMGDASVLNEGSSWLDPCSPEDESGLLVGVVALALSS